MSQPNDEAAALITRLGLQPLPREGGYYARTWTSHETLANGRAAGTAIYFLLTKDAFSALHTVDADELWHFESGDAIEHVQLSTPPYAPKFTRTLLGATPTSGEHSQLIVPAGVWQGARLAPGASHGWALVSCTMCPGWDEAGFTLGSRTALLALYPENAAFIHALTRTT
jgi:uncharacterized protein